MGTCICSIILIIIAEVHLFSLLYTHNIAYKLVLLRIASKVISMSLKALYEFALWTQCSNHNMIYFVYLI